MMMMTMTMNKKRKKKRKKNFACTSRSVAKDLITVLGVVSGQILNPIKLVHDSTSAGSVSAFRRLGQ